MKKLHINQIWSFLRLKRGSFVLMFLFVGTLLLQSNFSPSKKEKKSNNDLFNGFVNPPSESRPFVRWWWNGNHITVSEITRQLEVLKAAGIGGVEINPIAMPLEAKNTGTKPVEWLSMEWNQLLAYAAAEAKKRGMITDMIVGSGWPFGGEFLKEEETVQRVICHKISYSKGAKIQEDKESLVVKAIKAQSIHNEEEPLSNEMLFLMLVPVEASNLSKVIDLTREFKKNNQLTYLVPEENYELVYGVKQKGHRSVVLGTLGSKGPVMNHYDREVTLAYLSRLKKISEDTGISSERINQGFVL